MNAKTSVSRLFAVLLFAGLLLGTTAAQAFPDRPINLVVPWGVGGGGDRVARIIGQILTPKLRVSLPVINVAGASGQVGLNKTLADPADGYNVVEITSDTYILFAAQHPSFKVSDFTPVAIIDQQPSGFFIREDSPWKTWDDVMQAAKSQNVTVAGSGFGTQSDVTVSYFNRALKLKFVSVPFAKPSLRWNSLLGNHTDLLYAQFGDLSIYLANKKLRPVLAFADQRLPKFPAVPTARELRYNIDITHFRAFAVKHGTDEAAYKTLVSAMDAAAKTPEYKKMLEEEAASPDSYVSGKQAQEYVEKWVADVRDMIAAARDSKGTLQGSAR